MHSPWGGCGVGVLNLPIDLNQFCQLDSFLSGRQLDSRRCSNRKYTALLNSIEQRNGQGVSMKFPHFKVAKYLNNLVKWQALANKHGRRTGAAQLWVTLKS